MDRPVAVIWVHYHTPELLRESVAAVKADLPVPAGDAELIVVDNGGLDAAPADTRLLRPNRNIGYAGGINLGVSASRSPNIVVMNPDVLVAPGCIRTLAAALQREAIVAPDLYLDRAYRFRMPPTEPCDFISVCTAELGRRDPRWTRLARRRWRRHAHRYWRARPGGSIGCHASGAMLGFTRETFQALGPWDEGFQLYFEETDWLERARRAGLSTALIPEARAVHLYARSSRNHPSAASWFAQSSTRFERRYFRSWQNVLLRNIRNRPHGPETPRAPGRRPPAGPAWVELSNAICGYPAAAAWVDKSARFALPPDVCEQLPWGEWWLRWVNRQHQELAVSRIRQENNHREIHA